MAWPDTYNLDTRNFQDLVNEAKERIPELCPDWTDHNVSDPGITLIELFAGMVDKLLYSVNKVPKKNYVKFLELMGLELQAARPAQTDVTFRFTKPLEAGDKAKIIPARTEVSNVHTETEDAIVFTTDEKVTVSPPLRKYLVVKKGDKLTSVSLGETGVEPFSKEPKVDDAFYIGYETNIQRLVLGIAFECAKNKCIGINPKDPPLKWEYWNGSQWVEFSDDSESESWIEGDYTGGLNNTKGSVILHIPGNLNSNTPAEFMSSNQLNSLVNGVTSSIPSSFYWIRCRVVQGTETSGRYKESPLLKSIKSDVIGVAVPASNARIIRNEIIGDSNGKPGQVFHVARDNMLPLREEHGETVQVFNENGEWVNWKQQENFSDSEDDDDHFVCNPATGEIVFGPSLRYPVKERGSNKGKKSYQHAKVPPRGSLIRLSSYRIGGGNIGNVSKDTLKVLRTSIPDVKAIDVTNRRDARGGSDTESVDNGIKRGPFHFRSIDRAVTSEDFKYLAEQASQDEIARVQCITPDVHIVPSDESGADTNEPSGFIDHTGSLGGWVDLRIVPKLEKDVLDLEDLKCSESLKKRVYDYLDDKRLMGVVLYVEDADYVPVSVNVTVNIEPMEEQEEMEVLSNIADAINEYIHPITGGPNGSGWPFGLNLVASDLYTHVQGVGGVESVWGKLTIGKDKEEVIELKPSQLLISEEHKIKARRG